MTLALVFTALIDTTIPCFFFNDTATTEIYTLSLHDALPISVEAGSGRHGDGRDRRRRGEDRRQADARRGRRLRGPQPGLAQPHVDPAHRLPRHVHAGGVRARRDRLHPREERRAHHDDELHDLRDRYDRVLDLWLRATDGRARGPLDDGRDGPPRQRVHDQPLRQGLRALRDEGLLPGRLDV